MLHIAKPTSITVLQGIAEKIGAIGVTEDETLTKGTVSLIPTNDVQFRDGGSYVWLRPESKTSSLEGWMRAVVTSFENEAAECGARLMKKHHPESHRVCKSQIASLNGQVKCELDGLVVGERCVLVIEAKTTLGVEDGDGLLKTMDKIR